MIDSVPRLPRWSDDELRAAVAASLSLAEVSRRLGLRAGGGTYASLRRHIRRLEIDDSHLPVCVDGRIRRNRAWSDEQLRDAVRVSESVAAVQRLLGYEPSAGMHRLIVRHVRRLGLDVSHFTGQGWARGTKVKNGFSSRPLSEILVPNSPYTNSARLRQRLIDEGLKQARCERCGLDAWQGELLPLTLDHINGDPTDNRLTNLRILCPNCHALTETWCGRNKGRAGRRTPTGREVRLRT